MIFRPLCLVFALLGPAQAQPRFWLATEDVITGRDMHRPDPLAYMDFFKPGAPWATGAADLSVFKVSAQFLLSASDQQISTVFADMQHRHVAMAVEMGATQREPGCGGGEGYMPVATAERIGKRVSGLGFKLDYMAMDEPVFMAHVRYWAHVGGLPDCHYPLPKLADQVALTVRHMRLFFPDLQVGDVEVVADFDHGIDWHDVVAGYAQFARLFKRATGTKLAFFHCDIAWRTNWRPVVAPLAGAMRGQDIRFGSIIGGTPLDATDQAFVETGLQRLRELQANPATRLDDVVIQSWQPRPTRFLPEGEPGTMTNLLLRAEQSVAGR